MLTFNDLNRRLCFPLRFRRVASLRAVTFARDVIRDHYAP